MIIFIVLVIGLWLVYKVVVWFVNREARQYRFPADAIDGLKLILRLVMVLIVVITLFTLIRLPPDFVITVSSFSGVIIGFASTEVMNQLIAGIYLITARPFGVRDLVEIDDVVGMVQQIGINYTLIQRFDSTLVKIPNKKILDSTIKNYTIKMTDEIMKKRALIEPDVEMGNKDTTSLEEKKKKWNKVLDALDDLKDFIFVPEITRYTFTIEVEFGLDPEETMNKIDELCKSYTEVFQYRPRYQVMDLFWRATYSFRVYCVDPYVIINNYSNFLADVAEVLYGEQEE